MVTPDFTAWDFSRLPEDEQIIHFQTEIFPLLSSFSDGTEFMEFEANTPWLLDFMAHRFQPVLEALRASTNETTLALRELVNMFYATLVTVEWQNRMNARVIGRFRTQVEAGDGGMSEEDVLEIYGILREAVRVALNDPRWRRQLCDGVAAFCLQAGVPSTTDNPLDNISSLRSFMATQATSTRESALQEEVETLRNRCRRQERIITSLTFRHILETLPGPRPFERGQLLSNQEHWKRFWTRAWDKAKRQPSSVPPHPLNPLVQQFPNTAYDQIRRVGTDLYGTLSANIHHFRGEIGVNTDQWDAMAATILKSLAPDSARL